MKHAYLIIAHNQQSVLDTLLDLLDDARNDIFLHVDARSETLYAHAMERQMKRAGYHVLTERVAVCWGDVSQVETELRLFEKAHAAGPYAYYHLLSGVDLPIKTQDEIHRFFDDNAGREFVSFWEDEGHRRDLKRKVTRYYLFTRHLKDKGTLVHTLTAPVRNLALLLQKLTGFRRRSATAFRKGSNWVSITHDFCTVLLAHRDDLLKQMRHTLAPDEIFLQSLLAATPYMADVYRPAPGTDASMRRIDWKRGAPYVWQETDYDELIHAPELFARKFSDATPRLLERLRSRLLPA